MAAQVNNYKCPACGGPLRFDGASGKLVCDYCGSTYIIEEIEKMVAEDQKKAEDAFDKAQEKKEQKASEEDYGAPDPEQELWGAGMTAYSCPSCGAELICDETTAATSCPYCGNPTIVPGQFAGGKKPDYIIPFKLSKEDAIKALKNHYQGKRFLPKSFTDKNHIEEIKGVYVPFWLYDLKVDASANFEATNSRSHREGDFEITDTDHFEVTRSGVIPFTRVPADASTKMPDDYMDSIEPYEYGDLKEFSNAYLPGFLADKYDVDPKELLPHIKERAEGSALSYLRKEAQGYDRVNEINHTVRITNPKTSYALLPVWLLSTRWNDKVYLFAMNGQTGRLVGDLPVDKNRYWQTFAKVWGIGFVICMLLSMFVF